MTLTKLRLNANEKGFTLIELMIVIAIIGILAAIAIPNFIAYRNKTFCSAAESDAAAIASAVADYFSIPTNTSITTGSLTFNPTGDNTWDISATEPNTAITISVTDGSGRCPEDYQTANGHNAKGDGWDGSNNYQKVITM
ncbi:MAG: prepilin-type N-terminal cleavage/methylation domain-containing protein [Desulfobulbus oligotrophicus]|jgi:prepilin-type N-terminal cleavage/methylation domain-containing protein|nr:prepilin-type N-terminal cleavage/methylation domain-containing protein [Desulfobulbus oligotrophicus]